MLMGGWGVKLFVDGEWVDVNDLIEKAAKVDAIKSWWEVFSDDLDESDGKERLAEVLGVKSDAETNLGL